MAYQRNRDEFNLQEAFELARVAVKSLMLVNGGAAVAILTFYGNLLAGDGPVRLDRWLVGWALIDFGIGVGLGLLTMLTAYYVQTRWGTALSQGVDEDEHDRNTIRINVFAIAVAFSSFLAFAFGVGCAAAAFMTG